MFVINQIFIICLIIHLSYAPPVKEGEVAKENEVDKDKQEEGIENYMEYHRYLSEVVQALESDPDFKEKLQKAPEEEIRSGKIADQLEFVSHHVRTKLDEIKRVELERLKDLVEKKKQLQENVDISDPTHKHLDHSNPHTFEIDDLKKLIAKTQEDLAEADKQRRQEFKEYEMQKELEKQEKLNSTNGEERKKLEKEFKEQEEKHKKHEKLHEPGHKAQLEEVWQEQDQMQQEFDPKTFFLLHDMDSNGLWDQNEVKALFLKELDKMYQAGAPEDDIRERIEEMERMRETVFKEVDMNRDGFIDFHEFLAQTKKQDFNEDHGWNGLDEQKPYTDEELQEYISRRQMHEQQFQHQPPVQYHGGPVPPGYHPNIPPQAQFHPGQVPQHQAQQVPQHQPQQIPNNYPDLNTNEIYSHHSNAIPQSNYQQHQLNQGHIQHQSNQVYKQNPVNVQQQIQQGHVQQSNQINQQNQGYVQPSQGYQQNQAHPQQQIKQGYQQQPNLNQAAHQQQNNFQGNSGNLHVQQNNQVNSMNAPQQNFQQPSAPQGINQLSNQAAMNNNGQNNQINQQQNVGSQGNVQVPVVNQV